MTLFALACKKCHRDYPGLRSVSRHYPKCNGEPRATSSTTSREVCPHCAKSYESKSGLSQHLHRAHPEELCKTREEAKAARALNIKPGSVFTPEDVRLMMRLERDLKGEKFMAKAMKAYLPNKTTTQIRNKRCETAYRHRLANYLLTNENDRDDQANQLEEEEPHTTPPRPTMGTAEGAVSITSSPLQAEPSQADEDKNHHPDGHVSNIGITSQPETGDCIALQPSPRVSMATESKERVANQPIGPYQASTSQAANIASWYTEAIIHTPQQLPNSITVEKVSEVSQPSSSQ